MLAVACGTDTQPVADPANVVGSSTPPAASTSTVTSLAVTTTHVAQTTVPSSEAPTVTVTPPSSTEPPDEPPPSATVTPPSPGDVAPGLAPFVDTAVADLASQLGIGEGDITVIVAELVVWPDGALGCPQPGMEYTQVRVDGYRILLGAKGARFAYHGGGARGPFLCEDSEG
jgi:hypothetical protein